MDGEIKMAKMEVFDWVLIVLILIGAINWGLVGLLGFNLVTFILGSGIEASIVYTIVGLAAVMSIFRLVKK